MVIDERSAFEMRSPIKQLGYAMLVSFVLCLSACTITGSGSADFDLEHAISAQSTEIAKLSTQVADQEKTNQRQWEAISYNLTQMPYALGLITPIPPGVTITPTAYVPEEQIPGLTATPEPALGIEYPPHWRTGIQEIDKIIDVVMSDDIETRIELVGFTTSACTTGDGLGGPPRCNPEEEDGKIVEAFPVSYSEGTQVRPENIDKVMNFSVRGLLAVYRVPDDAYETEYWPSGEYGVVFSSENGDYPHMIVLLVERGQIVRLDFVIGWPPFDLIWDRSDEFILPPTR
jgi:hypothetical protein